MSERPTSGLVDRIPGSVKVGSLAAILVASLVASGHSPFPSRPAPREGSGLLGVDVACRPKTTPRIADVVEPRGSVEPSVAFTCVDAKGNPIEPDEIDVVHNVKDGTQLNALGPGARRFILGYSYNPMGRSEVVIDAKLLPPLGSTPFGFIQLAGVDRINCEPAAIPTGGVPA